MRSRFGIRIGSRIAVGSLRAALYMLLLKDRVYSWVQLSGDSTCVGYLDGLISHRSLMIEYLLE